MLTFAVVDIYCNLLALAKSLEPCARSLSEKIAIVIASLN